MRYFHVPLCQISGNQASISGSELHHLSDVLRLREGDEIIILDGVGGIYKSVLMSCDGDVAVAEITTHRQAQPPEVEVTLFVGLPKADKMDLIVQKATELGAHQIVPVLCQHTVPNLSAERAQKRVARWRQIAVEASKQSRRPFFPSVPDFMRFDKALDESRAALKLIFIVLSSVTVKSLKEILRSNTGVKEVDIFVGPEGGFTEDEACRAMSAGIVPVSLGDNILRTETAAIAALAVVIYEKTGGAK